MTAAEIMANCKKSTDLASAVKDADIVIEAVVERMDVKKDVCKTTMDNGPSHIIFASNTSTMSITEIRKDCGAPERVCGIHVFNPQYAPHILICTYIIILYNFSFNFSKL